MNVEVLIFAKECGYEVAEGSYLPKEREEGKKQEPDELTINLGAKDGPYEFAVVHEFGHYQDYRGVDPSNTTPASGNHPILNNWWKAADNSKEFLYLKSLRGQDYGETKYHGKPQPVDHNYLETQCLASTEVFARSYAQYITMKVRELADTPGFNKDEDQELARKLEAQLGQYLKDGTIYRGRQWKHDGFEPIYNAFEDLFL
jgi:hypothetical protein